MHKNKLAKLYFYFPTSKNLKTIPDEILSKIRQEKMNNYLGYWDDEFFFKDFKERLGKNKSKIKILTDKEKNKISELVLEYTCKFNKILKFRDTPLIIYIFPWYPTEKLSKEMGGISAYATFHGVIHLYIDLEKYSKKSLEETMTHELNHLKYYENFENVFDLTIQDQIILEGLAECFRDDCLGGKSAPWTKNLNKKELEKAIQDLQPHLGKVDWNLHNEIFYGSKKWKRWTGYSVGYYLVKKYLKSQRKVNWQKLMKMKSLEFLN
jgi:uncharacterized protein YjaZ